MAMEAETNRNKIALSLDSVKAISKGMPGGFFIYRADESEEILAFNDIVVSIFGCSSDEEFWEYTGGNFSGMVFKDDLFKVEKTIEFQVAGDAHNFDHVEYRIVKKNGDMAWVDDFGRLVDTEEYGLVYYVFIQDITEKKRIQEENIRMQVELDKEKHLAETRDEFLFNVSHDIRTPMNAIMGFTDLALRHLDDREELLDDLDKVKKASTHMMSLIDDLLEMSHINSEHIELKPEVSCIETELDTVIEMLKLPAYEKGIELMKRLDIPPAKVIMDAHRFRRVMNNLIGNAIKFTPSGGKVKVEAVASEASASGYVRYVFKVSDTGVGMNREFMEKLFLPFSREETSTRSGASGTGLGLSIAKNLVDRMGGTIEVESAKNEGSTFTVSIPMKQMGEDVLDSSSEGAENAASDVKAEGSYHILLVEDMEINRKVAVKVLSEAGFVVEAVNDGADAVDRFKHTKDGFFDLVLMDIQMPIMNGYEATRLIRDMGREESKKIPILALSANAREEDKRRSLECGMNSHIAKPFKIAELIQAVNEEIKNYRT